MQQLLMQKHFVSFRVFLCLTNSLCFFVVVLKCVCVKTEGFHFKQTSAQCLHCSAPHVTVKFTQHPNPIILFHRTGLTAMAVTKCKQLYFLASKFSKINLNQSCQRLCWTGSIFALLITWQKEAIQLGHQDLSAFADWSKNVEV